MVSRVVARGRSGRLEVVSEWEFESNARRFLTLLRKQSRGRPNAPKYWIVTQGSSWWEWTDDVKLVSIARTRAQMRRGWWHIFRR